MPHRTQLQLIKRRLVGKEGSARVRELRAVLDDLPDYRNGPYADIRKWVLAQLDETRKRTAVVNRDSIAIRREGAAQIALVGPPNAGKSSLLQVLSNARVKSGDYAFTTTRPVPALTRIGGVLVQLVEIPGLIAGASDDRGGGRSLLSVLRSADGMVLCHDATAPVEHLAAVRADLAASSIDLPSVIAVTKTDEVGPEVVANIARAYEDQPVIAVSVLDDESLRRLREAVWQLTGLVRVYLRHDGEVAEEPVALRPPVTVITVAHAIHHDLGHHCRGAHLWGPSARFDGQRVGKDRQLVDGDTVDIIA